MAQARDVRFASASPEVFRFAAGGPPHISSSQGGQLYAPCFVAASSPMVLSEDEEANEYSENELRLEGSNSIVSQTIDSGEGQPIDRQESHGASQSVGMTDDTAVDHEDRHMIQNNLEATIAADLHM